MDAFLLPFRTPKVQILATCFFYFKNNNIYRQLGIDLTFTLFQALLQPELSEMEVKMSDKTEKLVNIILPDLLNYLGMVESGEIIEKRIEKNLPHKQKEEDEESEDNEKLQIIRI